MMMAAVYERLDVFCWGGTGRARGGDLRRRVALAMIPDFLNGAIQTVLTPRLCRPCGGDIFELAAGVFEVRDSAWAAAAAGALLLGGPVLRMFLSSRFSESVEAFKVLVMATIFNTVFTPLSAAVVELCRAAEGDGGDSCGIGSGGGGWGDFDSAVWGDWSGGGDAGGAGGDWGFDCRVGAGGCEGEGFWCCRAVRGRGIRVFGVPQNPASGDYLGTGVLVRASSMICSLRWPPYLALVSNTILWARTEMAIGTHRGG